MLSEILSARPLKLDSLAQCLGCIPTHSDRHLLHLSSLELSHDGPPDHAEIFLLAPSPPLRSQRFCKSPTNRFQRDVQHRLKHRWSAAISRLFSVSGLCSTPQSGFSKPPRAYRQSDSIGRVGFNFQASEVRCLGCWSCPITTGMTRRWQNIGPSKCWRPYEAT